MKRNSSKTADNSAKKHSGFTLVELVVVIAVLAILAGVGAVAYKGYIEYAKKSNDQVLLSAVNEAFAASCEDHRVDRSALPTMGATLLAGNADYKTIGGVGTVSGVLDLEGIQKSFSTYFSGNESTELQHYKTYQILYDGEAHMFTFNDTGNANQALAEVFRGSHHTVESMADLVNSLTELINNSVNQQRHPYGCNIVDQMNDEKLFGILNGKNTLSEKIDAFCSALELTPLKLDTETLKAKLEKLGLDDKASYNELVNGIVMCAAQDTLSGNTDELIDAVLNPTQENGGAIDGNELAAFPMVMAKLAGYYNSGYASQDFKDYYNKMFSNGKYANGKDWQWGVSGSKLAEQLLSLGKKANNDNNSNGGWQKYCESGDAQKDMQGYLAAMQLLAANGDKANLKDDDMIGTGTFADFVNGLLQSEKK